MTGHSLYATTTVSILTWMYSPMTFYMRTALVRTGSSINLVGTHGIISVIKGWRI